MKRTYKIIVGTMVVLYVQQGKHIYYNFTVERKSIQQTQK